jgi:predicted RNA-binding protein with PIN domain
MTYIIDGHNLIPKMPGINLSDPDDENELIHILGQFCRLRRTKAIVYFDQAPPGMSGGKNFGSVRANYIRQGRTADDAIMEKLRKMGRGARNVTVVSSDRQVQQAARAVHAKVMTSDAFAAEWDSLISAEPTLDPRVQPLSKEELAEWEALFKDSRKGESSKYNK